jgi:hypothetical protein
MTLLIRIALVLLAVGVLFNAISAAVDSWETGKGGYAKGLWRVCVNTGCRFIVSCVVGGQQHRRRCVA